MKLFKTLMVCALVMVIGTLTSKPIYPQKDCSAIEVKVDTEKSTNGLDNGQVTVSLLKGDRSTVKYIFCQVDGKVLNEGRFEINTLTDLPKGKYVCIVNTSDCSKKISFTIK